MRTKIDKKKERINVKDEFWGTLFAGIPVFGLIIFTFIPLGMAVAMSFMNIPGMTFDGAEMLPLNNIFGNYVTVLSDEYFWAALKNNLVLFLELPISIVLSIVIAELLSKKVKFTPVFKVILFIPYVCSVTATTFMWNWLLNGQYGIVNHIFGLDIQWLTDNRYFIWAIIIMGIWSTCGFRILLFTAAITNVNSSLKEAARIDGAGPIKVFLHVTIPAITPTVFYVLVVGLIGVFQEFTRIQVLDAGGTKCLTMVFYVYNAAFAGTPAVGIACAASIILALFIGFLTFLNFRMSKKWVNYDAE